MTRLCPSRYCPRTRRGADRRSPARAVLRRLRRLPPPRPPRSLRGGLAADRRAVGRVRRELQVDVRELRARCLEREAWLRDRAAGEWPEAAFSSSSSSNRSGRPAAGERALYVEHARAAARAVAVPSVRPRVPRSCEEVDGHSGTTWSRWRTSPLLVDQALQQAPAAGRLRGRVLSARSSSSEGGRALRSRARRRGGRPRHRASSPAVSTRSVTEENVADIAGVPLFVKYPGQRRGPSTGGPPRRSTSSRRSPTWSAPGSRGTSTGDRSARTRRRPVTVDGRLRAGRRLRGRGRSRRARDRPPKRGAVRSGRRLPVSARPPQRAARLGPSTGRAAPRLRSATAFGSTMRRNSQTSGRGRCYVPCTDRRRYRRRRGAARPGRWRSLSTAASRRRPRRSRRWNRARFISLVPEGAFRDGANSVDVYAVRDSRRRPAPRPPRRDVEPPRPAAGRAQRNASEAAGRRRWPPSERNVRGHRVWLRQGRRASSCRPIAGGSPTSPLCGRTG